MYKTSPEISIISPVYQAATMVDELVQRLLQELNGLSLSFEIILVDDGSRDKSWEAIARNCAQDNRVKGLKLSKNFGQHQAIIAGLEKVTGKWIVVMDCDLQDRPEAIGELYKTAITSSCDVVFASRQNRQDATSKRFASKLFYRVLSYLTAMQLDSSIANFGIYHQKVVKAVLKHRKSKTIFPLMVRMVGFQQMSIAVEHAARKEGESSYSISKQLNLAIDIILSFSDKPLRLMMKMGLLMSLFAMLFGLFNLYKYFSGSILVPGYASLIISIWFLSGLMIFLLGLIGLYVGQTFEKTKDTPAYIEEQELNFGK